MKRRLYLLILFAAVAISSMAQNIGEAFYIYRNDGGFNAFFRDEVISMEYSYEDAEGNTYDEIVTQIINTVDSVYYIPLSAIDSVSFIQPETKYNNNVVKMEPLLPYIISVDGLAVTFSNDIPASLMPKEGDVLIHDNFDSEILPEGFAGRIIQCNGQKIICDSISFEDIYEEIVCCGRFDAIDDAASKIMRFVPRRADFTSGIEINGIVGSKGSGIYCSARGNLGLTLRVCLKYSITQPPYFELSLTPDLKLAFEIGVKGHLSSENLLSNRYTLIALPIPDTPFMFRVWGGEVLNCSVDASVTASTEASLGFKIGVKYEDGAFKGICQNTSKWFSTPNVTGNISGSIFGGIQLGFGICTYGNVISLNLENEAGAEFVANLSEDLMNSNKYEELQKAHFDLNLKATTGLSIYAQILKWVNTSEKWNLLSARMNINSWKLVPAFQKPSVTINDLRSADISVIPSEKLLFPVSIGIGVWDEADNLFDAQYCPNTYRAFENWGLSQFQTTITDLLPNQNYMVYPLVKLFGIELRATPSIEFGEDLEIQTGAVKNIEATSADTYGHIVTEDLKSVSKYEYGICYIEKDGPDDWIFIPSEIDNYGNFYVLLSNLKPETNYIYCAYFKFAEDDYLYGEEMTFKTEKGENPIPVKIINFEQTGSVYKENAFTNDGELYSYKFNCAVTVELTNNENVEDWGYMYQDPFGNPPAIISLKSYDSPFTDTRYSYYRNEPSSTVRLYEYVKYKEDSKYYYGEPKDYPVTHKEQNLSFCPDNNHPHWIDLGIGKQWRCCNVGASSPEDYGGYYTYEQAKTYNPPSFDQIKALVKNCSSTWTTQNGVSGRKFTGPNGSSIFLPAAGVVWWGKLNFVGEWGGYWSSTAYSEYEAYELSAHIDDVHWDFYMRDDGLSVRPVR